MNVSRTHQNRVASISLRIGTTNCRTGFLLLPPALLEANGMMRMAGFFPSVPQQVNFEMLFAPVNGQWRLFGLSVNIGQSGPAAPQPPIAAAPSPPALSNAAAPQAKPAAAPTIKPAAAKAAPKHEPKKEADKPSE
jgi:hypothetical protein